MAYKHYILGVLDEKPMSGYSLYKFFYEPFGRPLSQIYRTLNNLSKEGLVEVERVTQEKLPSQNVYHITEAGRAEFIRWLEQHGVVRKSNEWDIFGKLWFGVKADKKAIIMNLKSFLNYAEKTLRFFTDTARAHMEARAKKEGYTTAIVYRLLALDYGIKEYETAVDWARSAIEKMEEIS